MADKCDPIRSEIGVLRKQLSKIPKTEKGPNGKPVANPDFGEKQAEIKTAEGRLKKCESTLPDIPTIPKPQPQPPSPVPVTLTLTKFDCRDQSDEIIFLGQNLEDDEPYAVAWAVDLKDKVAAGAINSKMTLVGPLADVDPEIVSAPPNVIWGLSDAPDFVTSADNLIVLVAMMENDTGSPGAVQHGAGVGGAVGAGRESAGVHGIRYSTRARQTDYQRHGRSDEGCEGAGFRIPTTTLVIFKSCASFSPNLMRSTRISGLSRSSWASKATTPNTF